MIVLSSEIMACLIFLVGVPLGVLGIAGYNISIVHENREKIVEVETKCSPPEKLQYLKE